MLLLNNLTRNKMVDDFERIETMSTSYGIEFKYVIAAF